MADTSETPITQTPKIIWHGNFLDGKLTIQTAPIPNQLEFILSSFDIDFCGIAEMATANANIDNLIETIREGYLDYVMKTQLGGDHGARLQ